MAESQSFEDIVKDACELVKRAAGPDGKTLSVSPEVAAMLNSAGADSAGESELAALADTVSTCAECRLAETRTQTVFGDGNPRAPLVFVGEAPGYHEDVQGKPFVGRAGQLLTDIIVKGMKLTRQDVYICNVLKCRPPNNRDPRPDEVRVCEPYLVRQLELIQPRVICALGGHAAKTLLKTDQSIGRLRGKWYFYHGIPLRITYHPAYLLRNPADKGKTWADIQEVMKVLSGEANPVPEPESERPGNLFQ